MSYNRRRTIYIYKDFQRSFVFSFCLATFGAMLTTSIILIMLFLWTGDSQKEQSISLLLGINSLVLLVILILAGIVALLVSHKIGGPLYRVESALEAISLGDLTEEVHLREDDQLKQLAAAINHMTGELRDRVISLDAQIEGLEHALENDDLKRAKEKAIDLKRVLAEKFVTGGK